MTHFLLALTTADVAPYVMITTGVLAILGVLVKMLTALLGIQGAIGSKSPRSGLLGDVEGIKDSIDKVDTKVERVEEKQHSVELKIERVEANTSKRRASDK